MSGGTTVADCRVVQLPRIARLEGQLTAVEGGREVPFEIARAYYLYDIPGGETRGGHAHLALEQLIVSVMGSFDVLLDDGDRKRIITLNRAYEGLLMPRMIWRELLNFSSGAVCLVLASLPYDEADYVRDYSQFLALKR
jgi:hypothetical protein